MGKKKKKDYLFFSRETLKVSDGMIKPVRKFVKSKKFNRGY